MGRPTAGWGSINCAGAGQPGRVWQARTAPGVAMLPGEAGINVRKTARYASKDCDPLQEAEAQGVRAAIAARLKECGLELHPEKTKVVYCKDDDRRRTYPNEKFDFLGYTFRPRRSKNRRGKYFINFSPAVSDKAVKAIRVEIRSGDLHLRSDKRIEDLSRMFNPKIRGWLQYYGRYYRSALYPPMRQLDRSLARWAERKYRKLRGHLRRATHWVARISRRDPKLWAHWQMGVRRGSMAGAV